MLSRSCPTRPTRVGDRLEGGVHQRLVEVQHQGLLAVVVGPFRPYELLPVHLGGLWRNKATAAILSVLCMPEVPLALRCEAAEERPEPPSPAFGLWLLGYAEGRHRPVRCDGRDLRNNAGHVDDAGLLGSAGLT